MSRKLILHELTPSPNNQRTRLALALKELDYERRPFDIDGMPGSREAYVELSGQPRLPILQHGEVVVYDSFAIQRYLDANFRGGARLYSADYAEMGQIEEWEQWTRTVLATPMQICFGQAFAETPDARVCADASRSMTEVTERIEHALRDRPYLMGDTPTAADLAAMPVVTTSLFDEVRAQKSPLLGFFREHFRLGEGRERTRAWVDRLAELDPVYAH